MQVPSIPPPIVTNVLPQDVVTKVVSNVQAVAPLLQNAVAPTPKTEKSNQSRSNKERAKGGGHGEADEEKAGDSKRGSNINLRV